jgi:superfamily I DNA/RNA helicase
MNPFQTKATSDSEETVLVSPFHSAAKRLSSGTQQQEALWVELCGASGKHLLVEARAGSGKSSSCREGMWRMLERKASLAIRYAVFNAQNAREFKEDCPPCVEVGTVHSFGYAALQRAFASKLEKLKTYLILDESREGKSMPRYLRRSISFIAAHAKNQGYDPRKPDIDRLIDLAIHYDTNTYGRPAWCADWAQNVLLRSLQWTELVDFDDMIWLPGMHRIEFPQMDALFLDEVQDWNPAQHALIPLMCRSGRVIAVGDRYQAIYAFRGADADSIPNLARQLGVTSEGLTELPLTITWRCPRSHVALAQKYVFDIESHPNASDGEIGTLRLDQAAGLFAPGDMVLSPTNAPLIQNALRLIASRRRCFVRGRAVGDQLIGVLRQCGEAKTISELGRSVRQWHSRELTRLSDMDGVEDLIESVQDRADGLLAIVSTCDSPNQVEGAIGELFTDVSSPKSTPDAVVFSTIHRAKGLEAQNIWLLKPPTRMAKQAWEEQQQRNLRYVGLTRSKHRLVFVEMPKQ